VISRVLEELLHPPSDPSLKMELITFFETLISGPESQKTTV
jgi:hypothetical protein